MLRFTQYLQVSLDSVQEQVKYFEYIAKEW